MTTKWSKELTLRQNASEEWSEIQMMRQQAQSDGLDFTDEEMYPGSGRFRAYTPEEGLVGGGVFGKSRRDVIVAMIARERAKGYLSPP